MRRMNYIIGTDPLAFWGPLLPHIFWITNGPRRPLTSCSAFTSRSNFDLLVKKGKPPTVQKDCWSEPAFFRQCSTGWPYVQHEPNGSHVRDRKSPYHLRQQLRFLILNRNSARFPISHHGFVPGLLLFSTRTGQAAHFPRLMPLFVLLMAALLGIESEKKQNAAFFFC